MLSKVQALAFEAEIKTLRDTGMDDREALRQVLGNWLQRLGVRPEKIQLLLDQYVPKN